jgi:thiol-disulfide isomerase/thioredoxin
VPAQLQFTAKTVDGQEFKGESVLGKPAVFWFWAPWCPTCQREAPMVGRVADTHRDVTFVGVAALDQVPAMQEFVDRYPVKGFSHLADTDGAVWAKFGVTQQPAFAFVSADGSVDVVRGEMSEPALTERITTLTSQ